MVSGRTRLDFVNWEKHMEGADFNLYIKIFFAFGGWQCFLKILLRRFWFWGLISPKIHNYPKLFVNCGGVKPLESN